MNCPACGFANAAAVRFCGGCGKPVEARPSAEAERRQLTVVFCDLVGSTALSQSLDPEDLRDLIAAYQRVCSDAVERHDGHIAQYLGDGVLIYFGFPHAHEDDARRAVRCGLEILADMRELKHAHAERMDAPLRVRIGAHTGRVVVGSVGAGPSQESLALGDTPNIAARLGSIAEPDTLVVSDSTWRIVRGFMVGVSLGDRELKGVAEATRVWHVLGTSGAESRLEVAGELTPYVGRDRERSTLEERWSEARSGTPRFVMVRGEAGIGKSRLVDVFRRSLEGPDLELLDLRCTPYSQDSAYLPVIQVIERRLGIDRTVPAEERLDRLEQRHAALGITAPDAAPLIAALLSIPTGDRYPTLDLSPVRRRARTQEILVDTVHRLASQSPTLLVAEDLHWADPSTLELLHLIVSAKAQLPMLGVFTCRPEFEPPWPLGDGVGLIELSRLGNTEVEAIVHSVAHGKAMPAEVVREIVQRCDGVPLFVEEVARAVLESGTLEERETSWALTGPLPEGLIPATVDASLTARIDRLGDARATAQLGATIGREFSFPLIRAVSERDEQDLRQDLHRIVDSGLLKEARSGGHELYVFKHALVRDAAYESLLRSTRQRFHERIAQVLRAEFQVEVEHQPELVARHLTGAGSDAEATEFWETAGMRALQRASNREAIAHLESALRSLKAASTDEASPVELRIQLSLMAAQMAIFGWAHEQVEASCRRAIQLSTALADHQTLFGATWGMWTVHFLRCELDVASAAAEKVLAMAESTGVPFLQPPAHHAVGFTEYCYGHYAAARDHGRRAQAAASLEVEQALVSAFQFPPTVACLSFLANCLFLLGEPDHDQAREEAFALCRQLSHAPSDAFLLGFHVYSFHLIRDVDRIRAIAPELLRLTRHEGFTAWIPVAELFTGWLEAIDGRGEGVDRMRLAIQSKSGTRNLYTYDHLLLAEGLVGCGDDEGAAEATQRGIAFWRDHQLALAVPELFRLRGEIFGRRSDVGAALEAYDLAMTIAQSHEARSYDLRAAISRHVLLRTLGREAEGRAVLQRALAAMPATFDSVDTRRARSLLTDALVP